MVDWWDMEEFQGVDLNDSWVLSWEETEDNLVFQIEASLWPGHPKYRKPPKSDWTCYRKATLSFPQKRRADGLLPMFKVRSNTNPDGSIDYDYIDTLQRNDDGSFLLCGDFAELTIESDELVFHVT